ncbi:ADP-ribosylation factor-like protein 16 [Patiria miniata]|uniref:ADP-ribosylation factor-like protein 16 n=1 Tax=Patiria miniata TaxID=46514 RepID=A0A914AM17_PATMI|nr:ADP-ribosylation factor-like protein 16 [Patiria miniata]XP_038048896.1 ADP-ribosylation factor-like protein 16 [Patiria miniata]XP_038064473.1 ADP-ribosylation factor-like protein 16 [Patiria miniata]XP_038064474.1 ADP-ribosylation factor-like protein 16 [Patiria miniata]
MCLLIGMTGVGKTLLLKRLQNYSSKGSFTESEENPSTIPTVGTNLVNVSVSKRNEVTIRELGGAMAPIWFNYFSDCSALMFVIDASNSTQVSASCIQLLTTLQSEKMQKVNVLILLNKVDLHLSVPLAELRYLLRLDDLINTALQPITVLEISAKDGQGLSEVVKWLAANSKGGL